MTIGDPLAERMAEPYRQLYETAREAGSSQRGALVFTLGRHRSVHELFPGDVETAVAAEGVLEGRDLEESGLRARRIVGDVTPLPSPQPSSDSGQRDRSQATQLRAAAVRLGGDTDDVAALDEAVARRERGGMSFGEALADVEQRLGRPVGSARQRSTATQLRERSPRHEVRGDPPRPDTSPAELSEDAPTTAEDYQALGLSEADARAAARRNR